MFSRRECVAEKKRGKVKENNMAIILLRCKIGRVRVSEIEGERDIKIIRSCLKGEGADHINGENRNCGFQRKGKRRKRMERDRNSHSGLTSISRFPLTHSLSFLCHLHMHLSIKHVD